jgi:hypothetical protein
MLAAVYLAPQVEERLGKRQILLSPLPPGAQHASRSLGLRLDRLATGRNMIVGEAHAKFTQGFWGEA